MSSKSRNNSTAFIFILFSLQCFATVPSWNWAHNPGGHGEDWFGAMTCDASGNTYLTGGFGSNPCYFGSFNLYNSGSADICVAKYDVGGNVLWAKSAGSSGYEDGHAIAIDASGNVYVGGYFRSDTLVFASDTLINPSQGDEEIFIFKYDANGNELWAKRFGNTYHDELNAMTIDASGNVIIAGQFMASSITLGAFTLQNPYLYSFAMFVAKSDANGNIIWAMTPGGINVATVNSLSM
ncbi:MAG TPA: hypothetical protein VFJ43_17670, partial [Bacteroidia bacterium]|nr:hypothetical protein [Bacteroidia bacterium]